MRASLPILLVTCFVGSGCGVSMPGGGNMPERFPVPGNGEKGTLRFTIHTSDDPRWQKTEVYVQRFVDVRECGSTGGLLYDEKRICPGSPTTVRLDFLENRCEGCEFDGGEVYEGGIAIYLKSFAPKARIHVTCTEHGKSEVLEDSFVLE